MNGIKQRIEEIEAGGVDEQEKLRELEIAIGKFETVLHQSNEDVQTMPPLPPRIHPGRAQLRRAEVHIPARSGPRNLRLPSRLEPFLSPRPGPESSATCR